MALIDEKPRSASVSALETTTLKVFHRNNFLEILKSDSDVGTKFLSGLFNRLRDSNSKPKLQQELKDQRTFKRKDLLEDNLLDLEKDITFRENLLRVLAHDFQENLSLELKYKGKEFLVKLDIKEK